MAILIKANAPNRKFFPRGDKKKKPNQNPFFSHSSLSPPSSLLSLYCTPYLHLRSRPPSVTVKDKKLWKRVIGKEINLKASIKLQVDTYRQESVEILSKLK